MNKQLQVIEAKAKTKKRFHTAGVPILYSVRGKGKLEQLNKQALRVVLDDPSSTYEELLCKLHMVTLGQRRVQNMLVTVYKCLHGAAPSNLRTYLRVRETGSYFLRGYAKLKPPAVRTTTFGLLSVIWPPMHGTNYRILLGRLIPYLCLNINLNNLSVNR